MDPVQNAIALTNELLARSEELLTPAERSQQQLLSTLIRNPEAKALACSIVDVAFRSSDSHRTARCVRALGTPRFLPWYQRMAWPLLARIPQLFIPLLQRMVHRATQGLIVPTAELDGHLRARSREGIRLNVNRIGEAILGEEAAATKLAAIMADIQNPLIPAVSVKISSIFSQCSLLAYEATIEQLQQRLRPLLEACGDTGTFLYLDMEAYSDLHLTVDLFQRTLSEPQFRDLPAGIALQSYLPDSAAIQQQLTAWARTRGAPITIRLVKGANLGMERVEASLRCWPQAPYSTKADVDANWIAMLHYGLHNADAVHTAVASHNLFDIAYAICMGATHFEMLEGMAPHICRAVAERTQSMLLYCPVVDERDWAAATAYLMRRFDEATQSGNFLAHLLDIGHDRAAFDTQAAAFRQSIERPISHEPARLTPLPHPTNEPDTDLALPHNRAWAQKTTPPAHTTIQLLTQEQAGRALAVAQRSQWHATPHREKAARFRALAALLRAHRADLIGAIMAEVSKIFIEADSEVSEAIDFACHYADVLEEHADALICLPGRVAFVATPWNFPLSIPTSSILGPLAAGQSVLFKPAPEAMFVGSKLAILCREAGIPDDALQFLPCEEEPTGSWLLYQPAITTAVLTGATATGRLFLRSQPNRRLFAETGGKNSMIITAMADRDLALRDLVASAFGYSGQKCSACSLAILEREVYEDVHFRNQLLDAVRSLPVGSVWDPATRVSPLIRPPNANLQRALQLDPGEEWLLRPVACSENPNLLSPGIKWGVRPGSFTHQTELFGPLLGVMCADNLREAISFANGTPYGLTAGLHSLDPHDHALWLQTIEAGNCYGNRTITGAIVGRQPFGGCKGSSFGIGMKAGGANYLLQFFEAVAPDAHSYTWWWKQPFTHPHNLQDCIGQRNTLAFLPHKELILYLQPGDDAALVEEAAAGRFTICRSEEALLAAVEAATFPRVRALQPLPHHLASRIALKAFCIDIGPPLPHGRFELLRYGREVSVSEETHRYGSLMRSPPRRGGGAYPVPVCVPVCVPGCSDSGPTPKQQAT